MKIICDNKEQFNALKSKITSIYDGKIVNAMNTVIPSYIELMFGDSVTELKVKRVMAGKCCELKVVTINK